MVVVVFDVVTVVVRADDGDCEWEVAATHKQIAKNPTCRWTEGRITNECASSAWLRTRYANTKHALARKKLKRHPNNANIIRVRTVAYAIETNSCHR